MSTPGPARNLLDEPTQSHRCASKTLCPPAHIYGHTRDRLASKVTRKNTSGSMVWQATPLSLGSTGPEGRLPPGNPRRELILTPLHQQSTALCKWGEIHGYSNSPVEAKERH